MRYRRPQNTRPLSKAEKLDLLKANGGQPVFPGGLDFDGAAGWT